MLLQDPKVFGQAGYARSFEVMTKDDLSVSKQIAGNVKKFLIIWRRQWISDRTGPMGGRRRSFCCALRERAEAPQYGA